MKASVFCPHCHKHTELSIAPAHYMNDHHQQKSTPAAWRQDYGTWWIGICNACQSPCLVLDNGKRVYPHPTPTPTDKNIPPELASDLNESKLCFSVGCYRACAAMARRCVQNTCIAKGAKEKDLVKQIQELTALGVITKDIEEWATVVRWIGNDAAHPGGDTVEQDDADDSLKLAEQILHIVFVAPAIAKARRSARGK
jgi:hypothetical protein